MKSGLRGDTQDGWVPQTEGLTRVSLGISGCELPFCLGSELLGHGAPSQS